MTDAGCQQLVGDGAGLLAAAARGDVAACKAALDAAPPDRQRWRQTGDMDEYLEMCNAKGETALIIAAREGHIEVCRLLLEQRADVEATDRSKKTPLYYAAKGKHETTCQLLLDYGADVEATDCIVRDYGGDGCHIL
eukprot:gnl/TRDRNA2_/TRDRNA2_53326_c0_seq1.p1 gnl/TRDRNA2_/TRDRNA2_53326_c0~~gnl/TRDRNA2_/TRDRNA2_53326_c0_seq1.p1  ORF type:complete len:137 (+),score=25.30 gnl/TRDRNA2_/TRDRNA2_53326_c0_seq1:102-512(+)